MIDNHPLTDFDQLEADLFFKLPFNESIRLNIPTNLKNDLFIIGKHEHPIYTEEGKIIDDILSNDIGLTSIIFPEKSPSTIDDDNQLCNNDPSTMINKRYCPFENDTQEGWRQAIFTSMALLSDRISTIEIIQKSIQVVLNNVLDKTNSQMQSINQIHLSLNGIKKNEEDINEKINDLEKTSITKNNEQIQASSSKLDSSIRQFEEE
ncbi:unnamed protein product [Rotaria sp. Silwood1]|nr:unnamed protein product [Rotaria sp. Silwood1]